MKKFFSVICAVLLLIPMRVSAADTITFTPHFPTGMVGDVWKFHRSVLRLL